MSVFVECCVISAAISGIINYAFLVIIADKLREIKIEISRLEKQKGGE